MQRKIVKSVKKIGVTPDFVYNLRVAQNHNYFANCILLHNCDDLNAPSNNSEAQLERALEFFTSTLPTRFNDLKTGRLVNCQQRLDERDISGFILANMRSEYTCLILPMEYEQARHCKTVPLKSTNGKKWEDPRKNEGELLMPDRVGEKELRLLKSALASEYAIAGQLQQRPAPAAGGIIKKAWFQPWKNEFTPHCSFVMQAWDTASSVRKEAAYSACLTIGIFKDEQEQPALILLGAWRKRVEFPELYETVQRMTRDYGCTTKDRQMRSGYKPDLVLVEEKSTGIPLIQTLNKAGAMLTAWRPDKYGDKVERVRRVTHLLEAGRFYVPMMAPDFSRPRKYADVLINQAISFPNADSRDFVDCVLGDTLIYVEGGVRKISDLKVGDKVLTHRGRYREVTRTMNRVCNNVFRIKANTLQDIYISGDHPVLSCTTNGHRKVFSKMDWVKTSDLKAWEKSMSARGKAERVRNKSSISNELVMPCGFFEQNKFIDLEKYFHSNGLKKQIKYVNGVRFFRAGRGNWIVSSCELTKDFGWALGLYAAEGCIGNESTLVISMIRKNRPDLERFTGALVDALGLENKKIRDHLAQGLDYSSIAIGVSAILGLFKDFGTHAKNKTIPTWVMNANDDFCFGFIQGYSAGDGWLDKNGTNAITTASINMAHQLRLMMLKVGLGSSLLIEHKPPNSFNSRGGTYYRISYNINQKKITPVFSDGYAQFPLSHKEEFQGEHKVYNISVDEDESYVTTGGTVHNCLSMLLQRVINSGWILHPLENQARIDDELERSYTGEGDGVAFY